MAWGVPKLGAVAEVASGNLTLAEPAGTAQGDLQVACIAIRSTVGFTNTDWTKIEGQLTGDTDATNGIASGEMWYRIRGASAGTLQWSRTAGDLGRGCIVGYTGGKQTVADVLSVHSSNTLAVASGTVTTATITTGEANELIVAMTSAGDNLTVSAFDAATDPTTASGATDTTTAPTAGTWIERVDSGTNTGADGAIGIADAIRATAGATGTIQATISASARHVMIASAFRLAIPTSVTTGLGLLTVAGLAPTVSTTANVSVTTGLGVVTATGLAPTAVVDTIITTGLGAVAATGFAPTAVISTVVATDVGTLTVTGLAPIASVSANQNITIDVGAVDAIGFAPSASVTENQSVTTGVGSVLATGLAPTVAATNHQNITTDVGALTISGLAPTVQTPGAVLTDVGVLTITGFAPVIGAVVDTPALTGVGVLTVTGLAPTVTVSEVQPEDEGPQQGKGGGRYIDPYQSYPQKLTLRITSAVEVSSAAVFGVRVPETKIPGVSLAIRSLISAPSSRGTFRERLGMTVVSSIQVGSDSRFEETIHLSAVEYERMTDTLDDDEVMMLHEMAMV